MGQVVSPKGTASRHILRPPTSPQAHMGPKVCRWDEQLRIRYPGEASSSPTQGLPLGEGGEAVKEELRGQATAQCRADPGGGGGTGRRAGQVQVLGQQGPPPHLSTPNPRQGGSQRGPQL